MGRVGGQQFVNMQPFCFPTIHEVIHALGFAHEEERRDRDYYMAFNWKNIKAGILIVIKYKSLLCFSERQCHLVDKRS